MTKTQEIEALTRFVESLPDGYLRDILTEAAPLIVDAIRNDVCTVPLVELWAQKSQLERENKERRAQMLRDLETGARELRDLERRRDAARQELAQIRNTAARLCAV